MTTWVMSDLLITRASIHGKYTENVLNEGIQNFVRTHK